MASTECGHGHIYDPDLYPSCPYCNSAQPIINFGSGGGYGQAACGEVRTAPIDGGYGLPAAYSEDKTAPLNGYGPSVSEEQAVWNGDVTRPPLGYASSQGKRASEEQRTVGMMQKKLGMEPVVGWLVCVQGEDRGRDYRLMARINSIGRSEKMDVCIRGDQSISKENHARLGYESKHNTFHLIPADSTNPIYLNDQVVYVPTPLSPYDLLEFGETRLVFIPLCSARFNWSDGVVNSEEGR